MAQVFTFIETIFCPLNTAKGISKSGEVLQKYLYDANFHKELLNHTAVFLLITYSDYIDSTLSL